NPIRRVPIRQFCVWGFRFLFWPFVSHENQTTYLRLDKSYLYGIIAFHHRAGFLPSWVYFMCADRRPLPNVFNGLRTLSFSVDKRTKPNPFTIIRLRTLSQNMGGGGGMHYVPVKVILELPFQAVDGKKVALIRGAGGGKALFGGVVVEVQKLRRALQQIRR